MAGDVLLLLPLAAVVAFFYGSVGLGGGSAYVALLVVAGVDHTEIPMVALALNLIVASGGFAHYLRGGHFRTRAFIPLAAASAPAAFLAAQVPLGRAAFSVVLGVLLLAAGVRMVAARWLRVAERQPRPMQPLTMAVLGLVLGAAAGLTGIGGGIYLAPLLLIGRLARPKEAAALASGIVLVNSAFGLGGRVAAGAAMPWELFLPLAAAVLVAGQLGAYGGARRFRPETVQATFGALVLLVAARLLVSAVG